MARSRDKLGRVVRRQGAGREDRWRIDFGSNWPGRFLHSFRGVAFESEEMARAILAHVEVEVAKGRPLHDVLSEFAPGGGQAAGIRTLLDRWVEVFRRRVETGSRAPRTLREYERWAGPEDSPKAHFSWWYGASIWEVDPAGLEEWSYWMHQRGLSPKTQRNVMAGLHSFLTWVARDVRGDFDVPAFPWPEVDEHAPKILAPPVQAQVLAAIPKPKAGIFYCMAQCLVRPGEARALRVRDWLGDDIRVARAAKDRLARGEVRGLKSRNVKTVFAGEWPLGDWLLEHVSAERRLADPDGPLFANPDGHEGGWWSETAMRRTWAKACREVGVPGVSLYEGLKHSSATHLKAMGADDRLLAAMMGHRDPRSVEKYAKLQGSAIREALRRLRDGERR